MSNLFRKSHLLGAKLKNIRKLNKLTLEDLSERCSQSDPKNAPSVSYLSMIENGKRLPSEEVLKQIAIVFQKDLSWFMDENLDIGIPEDQDIVKKTPNLPLEPGFLYSKELLQGAIPELLDQSGISGRQFAHLLIRSFQEANHNRFPDIEKVADEIGKNLFPIKVSDIRKLYKTHGLKIKWFKQNRVSTSTPEMKNKMLLRSFFESPSEVYINESLKKDTQRLKYDLATHLGHKILHQGDGLRSIISSGSNTFDTYGVRENNTSSHDVLMAWHDFESSFFAGALLCPRKPFRSYLIKKEHDMLTAAKDLELSPAHVMRRVTAVSSYIHWHYFEAYQPGYLSAIYRGNGIPLPFGNMSLARNPCPNWTVFRLLNQSYVHNPQSQISLLKDGEQTFLYACYSIRRQDLAGNLKLYSLGIDLVPALRNQGIDPEDITLELERACQKNGGDAEIESNIKSSLEKIANILRIFWIRDALDNKARIICPKSSLCPRTSQCQPVKKDYQFNEMEELKDNILMLKKAKLI
jgi:transcriptional regulator with XRE-family HTH domain/Zn-dependent peptidase ImmA (M78 family)